MSILSHENEVVFSDTGSHRGGKLIHESHGAVKGFCMGLSYYPKAEYGEPGIHEDQEGFYVLAGSGTAKVGEEEFQIEEGAAFIAQAGVPHAIKKGSGCDELKVLWSHGAI